MKYRRTRLKVRFNYSRNILIVEKTHDKKKEEVTAKKIWRENAPIKQCESLNSFSTQFFGNYGSHNEREKLLSSSRVVIVCEQNHLSRHNEDVILFLEVRPLSFRRDDDAPWLFFVRRRSFLRR